MVDQAVPASEQKNVQFRMPQDVETNLHVVHTETDMPKQALGLHPLHLGKRLGQDLPQDLLVTLAVRHGVAIVDVGRVEAGQAESLKAVFHAATHSCCR